jgi:hypothetical protein
MEIAMRFARRLGPSILAPLVAGCFVGTAMEVAKSEPAGSVHLDSAALGELTLAPAVCESGERRVFLGADFVDSSQGITTRLIVDPAGTATLRFFATERPLDQGTLFRREDCDRFELSLARTGWQVNEVYDLEVRLDFACRTESGDSAEGSLRVDHCH